MHHVVRNERVETRSRVHHHVGKAGALRFYRIPSLTSASKYNYHFLTTILLLSVAGSSINT